VLGDEHHSTTLTMNDLATLLSIEGKRDESESLFREALARRLKAQGPEDTDTLQSKFNLGRLLTLRGKYAEAEPLIVEALAGRRKVLGERHPYTTGTTAALAELYERQERFADAEPLLTKLVQPEMLKTFPAAQQTIVITRYGLCLAALDKRREAEPVLLDAERRLTETKQPGSDEAMRKVLTALAKLYNDTDRPTDAARWSALLTELAPASTQTTTAPSAAPTTQR
jgi:tetratricopeptide (TPR) repeat protein